MNSNYEKLYYLFVVSIMFALNKYDEFRRKKYHYMAGPLDYVSLITGFQAGLGFLFVFLILVN